MDDGIRPDADAPASPPAVPGSRNRWNREREAIFFELLALTCNVTYSARKAGMGRMSAYRRKNSNPDFAAAWLEALEVGFAELETEMLRQALHGSERTEIVTDGKSGKVKQKKTIHYFPHHVAMRMLQVHRGTVERYRMTEQARIGDADMLARIEEEMARVHERLADESAEQPGDRHD